MCIKRLTTPLTDEAIASLKSGDQVTISGVIYTARDAAHQRMADLLNEGKPLPIRLDGQILFYAGPAPTPPGGIIGAIGPTTASRMDPYTPALLARGLKGMIGKGKRAPQVRQACREEKAVYFTALGGVAALTAQRVRQCKLAAWGDLGPEAIYALEVEDLPAFVINDCYGNDLYEQISPKG